MLFYHNDLRIREPVSKPYQVIRSYDVSLGPDLINTVDVLYNGLALLKSGNHATPPILSGFIRKHPTNVILTVFTCTKKGLEVTIMEEVSHHRAVDYDSRTLIHTQEDNRTLIKLSEYATNWLTHHGTNT